MRYFKNDKGEFVENGRSKVRVGTMDTIPSPQSPGRILKLMTVVAIVSQNIDNPLLEGQCIALSFPESQVNNKDYVWHMEGPEECMVPLKLKLV